MWSKTWLPAVMALLVSVPLSTHAAERSVKSDISSGEFYREFGYLPMKDGVRLAYVVYRPTRDGHFPAVLQYDPYDADGVEGGEVKSFLAHGYAYVGVSVRGAGCSEGNFSLLAPIQAEDGAAIVEWIGTRSWSTGAVGMVGASYAGYIQISTASHHPEHLKALAAAALSPNLYDDVLRPGGIYNVAFASRWDHLIQPFVSNMAYQTRLAWGDQQCATIRSKQHHEDLLAEVTAHPFNDSWWRARAAGSYAHDVRVPTLMIQAFQDNAAQSTGVQALYEEIPAKKRMILENGSHFIWSQPENQDEVIRWMDRWLKGEKNGIDREPPVKILWEVHAVNGRPTASWTTSYSDWPPPQVERRRFYMTADGGLTIEKPQMADGDTTRSYTYPVGSELPGNNVQFATPPDPSGVVAYRTEPLAQDMTILGLP